MTHEGYDFAGWATKNDLRCADGVTIRKDAFMENDGKRVPLVWNHKHDTPSTVLGHAILENKEDGVYAYGYLNNTRAGQEAKEQLKHGDIVSLSIWANNLTKRGSDVVHGVIREVSLVLAGANPGAFVESVLAHNQPMDDEDDEGIFYTNEPLSIAHAESNKEEKDMADNSDKTVGEVFDTLTEEQKQAVAIIVGQAIEDMRDNKEEEEEEDMKHNLFESEESNGGTYISHADMETIFKDAKNLGSLREAVEKNLQDGVLSHAIDTTGMTGPSSSTSTQSYGVRDLDMLFPEARNLNVPPEFISREMGWVQKVMSRVHKTPFSRVRSTFANITEDEARAKGYIKGKQKKEEVFTLLKRVTEPQTIYKKQKLDRDDIIDITDFDVVAWIRAEMKIMFEEEKARAILIGDGRPGDSEDKIKEDRIRPIVSDVPLFNVKVPVQVAATADQQTISKETINAVIRARKNYKGSGTPDFYTTEDVLTEMLLLEDKIGNKLYKTEQELATALRVREIIPVEPMEGMKVTWGSDQLPLLGIIVNLVDYNVGSDPKGSDNLFDDFDIDYNQYKYLMEGRMSGALIKPYSALTVALKKETTSE